MRDKNWGMFAWGLFNRFEYEEMMGKTSCTLTDFVNEVINLKSEINDGLFRWNSNMDFAGLKKEPETKENPQTLGAVSEPGEQVLDSAEEGFNFYGEGVA